MKKLIYILFVFLWSGSTVAFSQTDSEKEVQVLTVVEQMPQFVGGDEAMFKFIQENIKYPADAKKNNIQGKVYLKFVVTEVGKIKDVTVARGVKEAPSLSEEAIRVINIMPDWKPGKQNGKPVNVAYMLPINFKLDN